MRQREWAQPGGYGSWRCLGILIFAIVAAAALPSRCAFAQSTPAATEASRADFGKLAAKLTGYRSDGVDVPQAEEERALSILDGAALEQLNAASASLDRANEKVGAFATTPFGESYRVVQLNTKAPVYALIANFGFGGPSAVRVYAGSLGRLRLSGRVDSFAERDFFDDYIDLLPLSGADGVFLVVSGRTDELHTGVFTAWRFAGDRLVSLWTSDILEQSDYEVSADGLRLSYCFVSDDNDFRICRQVRRERYAWQDGSWKQLEGVTEAAPQTTKR